jgi:hypothetical protein
MKRPTCSTCGSRLAWLGRWVCTDCLIKEAKR